MIRLGLRLTLGSGREAALRVVVTAVAVALGAGLLLTALAGFNGLQAQADRGAWLDTSVKTPAPASGGAPDRLWWLSSIDQFEGQAIDRVDVAAAGPDAPVPPGVPRLPGPGQYFASPALTALLRSTPASELLDRYPGREIGILGAAALPSPRSLVILIGHSARQLSRTPSAVEVRAIQRTTASCFDCQSIVQSGAVLQWILVGGAAALVLPVLILIATAGRLSSARREERFAAMRLVGATPRQVSVVSAVEAVVAAVAGVVVGFGLFFSFRPLLVHVPFTGAPLAPGDLSLQWTDVLVVVLGVPIAAAVSALLALRRVQAAPLDTSRRRPSAPLRAVRVVPLLAGIALLVYFAVAGKPGGNGLQVLELLVCFVLLVVGLVLAGPWLTRMGSLAMATRASRPATLIAGRRLLDNPRGAFRAIGGLVLALFVTSAAISALSSILAVSEPAGSPGTSTLVATFCGSGATVSCGPATEVAPISDEVLTHLRSTPGVRGVAVVRVDQSPEVSPSRRGSRTRQPDPTAAEVVACGELAATPAIGRCAAGATVASIGYFLQPVTGNDSRSTSTVWPSAARPASSIASLPLAAVVVATDGSPRSLERARTALERAFPLRATPAPVKGLAGPLVAVILAAVRGMTGVIVVASLVIAACSLAVNIAAGLSERKRPFSLLRLTGVPTAVLHRIVALESALPLVLVAVVSIVVGLLSAGLYLHSQVGIAFRAPGIAYWAAVAGGLAAAMAIIAATFPILDRMTGPEAARNE